MRRAAILLPLLLAIVQVLPLPLSGASAAEPGPGVGPYAEVQSALRPAIEAATSGRLSEYRIDARVDEAAGVLAGEMTVSFLNDAGVPLREVWFRLFPNIGYYGDGALDVSAVTVDGAPAATALDLEDSALRVDLPAPLPPGARAAIAMSFVAAVPLESTGSYGIFHRDAANATWVLADWHPVLAVYDRGAGWNLSPPTPIGDPTYAASAMFDVRLDAPASWAAVASGVTASRQPAGPGRAESRFIAGPAREFTLALDDDWTATTVERDGVSVTAWTEPGVTDPAAARLAAESAAASLAVYNRLFAPYPFRELDLVDVPLAGALAVSWSGLIFLDGDSMLGSWALNDPGSFEAVVAHEVAHLWWGASVGNDSNTHPFMNEGLATLCSIAALRLLGHPGETAALDRWILGPAASLLAAGDAVVDLPASAPGDPGQRSRAIYAKSALGFLAIRAEIGDRAFWAGLDAVSRDFQFGIMTPADLRAAWETASGADLSAPWARWFDRAELTADDIAAIAASLEDLAG